MLSIESNCHRYSDNRVEVRFAAPRRRRAGLVRSPSCASLYRRRQVFLGNDEATSMCVAGRKWQPILCILVAQLLSHAGKSNSLPATGYTSLICSLGHLYLTSQLGSFYELPSLGQLGRQSTAMMCFAALRLGALW